MSIKRDLSWFRTNFTTSSKINIGAFFPFSLTASSIVQSGPAPQHPMLKGKIEHISVFVKRATGTACDILFFRAAAANATNATLDRYVDHESFATGDYVTLAGHTQVRASRGFLEIPYMDSDNTGKFHFGIKNLSGVSLTKSSIAIEWTWREDLGE